MNDKNVLGDTSSLSIAALSVLSIQQFPNVPAICENGTPRSSAVISSSGRDRYHPSTGKRSTRDQRATLRTTTDKINPRFCPRAVLSTLPGHGQPTDLLFNEQSVPWTLQRLK